VRFGARRGDGGFVVVVTTVAAALRARPAQQRPGQVVQLDHTALAHCAHIGDRVVQLAQVARPGVRTQHGLRIG
jgi:hypothetical protein